MVQKTTRVCDSVWLCVCVCVCVLVCIYVLGGKGKLAVCVCVCVCYHIEPICIYYSFSFLSIFWSINSTKKRLPS